MNSLALLVFDGVGPHRPRLYVWILLRLDSLPVSLPFSVPAALPLSVPVGPNGMGVCRVSPVRGLLLFDAWMCTFG